MDIEPTDEDIAEAIKIGSAGPSPSVREVRESVGTGLAWEADMYALALTLAKLRHAEPLIADRDAEIVRLRAALAWFPEKLRVTSEDVAAFREQQWQDISTAPLHEDGHRSLSAMQDCRMVFSKWSITHQAVRLI